MKLSKEFRIMWYNDIEKHNLVSFQNPGETWEHFIQGNNFSLKSGKVFSLFLNNKMLLCIRWAAVCENAAFAFRHSLFFHLIFSLPFTSCWGEEWQSRVMSTSQGQPTTSINLRLFGLRRCWFSCSGLLVTFLCMRLLFSCLCLARYTQLTLPKYIQM